MPTLSTISADDKNRIKASIPSSNSKILTATLARVYCAHPDPNSWSYSGLQGALTLTMDKNSGGFGFKLVDLLGTRGIIWEHEIWEPFEYNVDRPFFHSFAGDVSPQVSLIIDPLLTPAFTNRNV
jgi:neural Wiskott-Aldrich syndrome protein